MSRNLKMSREELAKYAAANDVQSLTGLFLAGFEGQARGITASRVMVTEAEAREVQAVELVEFPEGEPADNPIDAPRSVNEVWGVGNWGAEAKAADRFILDLDVPDFDLLPQLSKLLRELQETARNYRTLERRDQDTFDATVRSLLALVPGNFSIANSSVSDERSSRLIRRMDLTEWIAIRNRDILYYVISEAEGERHQAPLGRATVWVKGSAIVHIVRSKTSKSFVRGEITRQLKARELEPDLEGLYRAFFDVDAEDAFSSNGGTC